jgi:TRAP-type C4-dicarboxylate transport system substrate-binding protein
MLTAAVAALSLLGPRDTAHAFGPTVIKMATTAHADSPVGRQLRELGRHLDEANGGLVRIKLFTGGSLGDEARLLNRTAKGSLHVAATGTEALSRMAPELGLLDCAFLFADARHAHRSLDGPVHTLVKRTLERCGLVAGTWTETGFRSWYTKKKPVREPEDLSRLRLRVEADGAALRLLRGLGAAPAVIAPGRTAESLALGELDGFEAVPSDALAGSWYRSARHLTLSHHGYQAGMVVYSGKWFEGLPEGVRRSLTDIPDRFRQRARSEVKAMTPGLLEVLRQRGIAIHELDAKQRKRFVAAAREQLKELAAGIGDGGRKLLEAVDRAR